MRKCHAFVFRSNPYAELFWSKLGWEPTVSFEEMVEIMVDSDLELLRQENDLA